MKEQSRKQERQEAAQPDQKLDASQLERWTYRGKPLKVLSTSLGVALVANLLLIPAAYAADGTTTPQDGPKLVEWSTDAVKAYYDPQMDWNLPIAVNPDDKQDNGQTQGTGTSSAAPVIIHNGFGWNDLLLYHLIFNSGRSYSSSDWYGSRRVYYPHTSTPVKPRTYDSGTFQNKPTAGSVVRPKTTNTRGSITRRGSSKSSSSTRGSIGGRSGGFSSGFGG